MRKCAVTLFCVIVVCLLERKFFIIVVSLVILDLFSIIVTRVFYLLVRVNCFLKLSSSWLVINFTFGNLLRRRLVNVIVVDCVLVFEVIRYISIIGSVLNFGLTVCINNIRRSRFIVKSIVGVVRSFSCFIRSL